MERGDDMLREFTPEEIAYLSTTFALAMAKDQDIHSLRVLCSFFTNVVATINVVINQQALLENKQNYY